MMDRARLDGDVDELEALRAGARMRYAVAPLPAGFVARFGIPAFLAYQIARLDEGRILPVMIVISRADAEARVWRLNQAARADGFHKWN